MTDLVLASSSPYRKRLLERLRMPFICCSPDIDETPRSGEAADALAARLSKQKAQAIAAQYPLARVIGSDQVASLNGRILGKPDNFERARDQLLACSGQQLHFHTGVCLAHQNQLQCAVVPVSVDFRTLSQSDIEHYLHLDQPYDCAGSFKWEALGVNLFERLSGDDPTALEGLPLIRLCSFLRASGLDPLSGGNR